MINLPEDYTKRMKELLGDEYEDYVSALSDTPVRGLRVNTSKISVEDFKSICPFELKEIPYVQDGFYFECDHVGSLPFHHAGMFYVQEPGAMAPAEAIDINPEWTVLDMCAAPGGKSTQLKNRLHEGSVLISNEIIPSRCKILTGNIERLGLKNVVTTCMDSGKIALSFPKTFDLIMVDAPCSGEGMFRKDEIAIKEWSEENVLKCATRQLEILENAVLALKNGGYIIYATCTFSLEENEMVIDSFLKNHEEFELIPVTERIKKATCDGIGFDGCECENLNYCRRFYPHKNKGEGQFMAVLHNKFAEENVKKKKAPLKPVADETVYKFLDELLTEYDKDSVKIYNGSPVYFSSDFPVKDGMAFACGVTIGEVKKSYILPHHQFFMAMGKNFKKKIDLSPDSAELQKYLHGEEFDTSCENGWAVVTLNNCSIGGVKVVNGKAKNHYPKGLRTKKMHS